MIPFFQANYFLVGPVQIQVWGLLVSLGIIVGLIFLQHLAKKYFLSTNIIFDLVVWVVLSGLIGGRLFYVLFYSPEYFVNYPMDVFKFWQGGSSSLGGFFGAFVAMWIFAKIKKITWREFLPYFDIGILGVWLGWGIGRLGCFFIHDHQGKLSDFFLAVNFPNGARHDLGLYDSILSFGIFAIFYFFHKKLIKIRWGLLSFLSLMMYAVIRFFLDFLRATDLDLSDPRYGYLTPAQWGMIAIVVILTFISIYSKIRQKSSNGEVA